MAADGPPSVSGVEPAEPKFDTLEDLCRWAAQSGVDIRPFACELIARRAAGGFNPVALATDPSFLIENAYGDIADASRRARLAGFDIDPILQELLGRRASEKSGADALKRDIEFQAGLMRAGRDDAQQELERYKNYNAVVVGLGYAGYFALWGGFAGKVPANALALSGGLMLVSLISFVFVEVCGTLLRAIYGYGAADLVYAEGTDKEKIEKLNQRAKLASRIWRGHTKLWAVTFCISVLFGLPAAALLAYDAGASVLGAKTIPDALIGKAAKAKLPSSHEDASSRRSVAPLSASPPLNPRPSSGRR